MRSRVAVLFACVLPALMLTACKGGSSGTAATSLDPPAEEDPVGEAPAFPLVDHVDQQRIALGRILFEELFILGDELFEAQYTALDGVGIQALPDGTPFPQRFSRLPPGGGRFSGPNGQACGGCHNTPFPTSAGEAASNVIQDPAGAGALPFNTRNTSSLFGAGVIQRLAEEITEDLIEIREDVTAAALPGGVPVTLPLESKGIEFGSITATRSVLGVVSIDTSAVEGVDTDLVVRAFGWKGNVTTLRDFVRGAASNEMGMEPSELVAKDPATAPDPDTDGVIEEFSVGDITAITMYVAAQEVPTTLGFLVGEGVESPPTREVSRAIARGQEIFTAIGCAGCHVPELRLDDPVFEEPTLRGAGHYLDTDMNAVATGYDPDRPATFHVVRQGDLPRLAPHPAGGARVRLFGDMKRHRMGSQLADAQETAVTDATGAALRLAGVDVKVPVATFLTAELWGVGNTGPWLHDGRAATLSDAVLLHGVDAPVPPGDPARSEAQEARDRFAALNDVDKAALTEFLESLLLISFGEEE